MPAGLRMADKQIQRLTLGLKVLAEERDSRTWSRDY